MLRIIVALVVGAFLVVSVLDWNRGSDLQAQRTAEQGRLLAQLEAVNKPAVSKLVDEWRQAYPEPSETRLTELRVLVERVKADPLSADKFTAAAKQKNFDDMPFSSPLGTPKAKPGISG